MKDNISRLPIGFIKKGYADSFPFVDDPSALPKQKREEYYRSMADAIYADDDWKQFVTTRFRNAVTVALARVAWNYKTAIPVYYPTAKNCNYSCHWHSRTRKELMWHWFVIMFTNPKRE